MLGENFKKTDAVSVPLSNHRLCSMQRKNNKVSEYFRFQIYAHVSLLVCNKSCASSVHICISHFNIRFGLLILKHHRNILKILLKMLRISNCSQQFFFTRLATTRVSQQPIYFHQQPKQLEQAACLTRSPLIIERYRLVHKCGCSIIFIVIVLRVDTLLHTHNYIHIQLLSAFYWCVRCIKRTPLLNEKMH